MSKSKQAPTPGPWTVEDLGENCGGCRNIRDNLGDIACTAGLSDDAEDLANAHLMAAAPDLLAALEAADRALRKSHYIGPERDIIDAALSKSRGEGGK